MESFTYPDLLDLTKVISVQLLFARPAEYMLSFRDLLRKFPMEWFQVLFESRHYSDLPHPHPKSHSFSLRLWFSFVYWESIYAV